MKPSKRSVILASFVVLALLTLSLALLSRRVISAETAQQIATDELSLVARRLDVGDGYLIGPGPVKETENEFYFTWMSRERPDLPAVIVWVSKQGEADATILDDELVKRYGAKYEKQSTSP